MPVDSPLAPRLGLLFIGEAPPASGRSFYRCDSGLYRAMLEAFRSVDPAISGENFLPRFQSFGCRLIDLCPEPVDRLPAKMRRAACRSAEGALARTIARLQPPIIATLVRSIEQNVTRAAARAGWHGSFVHLPYPGRWAQHRQVFMQGIARALIPLLAASRSTPTPGIHPL